MCGNELVPPQIVTVRACGKAEAHETRSAVDFGAAPRHGAVGMKTNRPENRREALHRTDQRQTREQLEIL